MPDISIIIPVHNGERYIGEAVASVLDQNNVGKLEVIVVDDGSTDSTAAIATKLTGNVTYAYQENTGPAAARNRGISMAQSPVIGFLDADDLWIEGMIAKQRDHLDTHPAVDVVQAKLQYFCKREAGWVMEHEPFYALSVTATLFRRSAFERVGNFDPELRFSEDVDWYFRAKSKGLNIDRIPEASLLYRRHEQNITNNTELIKKYTLKALKKRLDYTRGNNKG
ncbi:MAG: glycosyltransferase family 2 protein [bacterium]